MGGWVEHAETGEWWESTAKPHQGLETKTLQQGCRSKHLNSHQGV